MANALLKRNDAVLREAARMNQAPALATRPAGTITFLFTDIEGSTQRWERHREAMADAVARHDTLLTAAIEAHGGYVFKRVGDAFCATFTRVSDGLRAALAAQDAVAREDFSAVEGIAVRMALHVGEAYERDGDYFGPAVNRTARLLAIGYGGQILVSGVAAGLLSPSLPEEVSLRDLGHHRLRDLAVAEHVHQVVAPALSPDFPPLLSLETLPNNLPLQVTNLIGRDRVVAEVEVLVARSRLVTLVGAGGIGKTRVALQVAADVLQGSTDGAWFVDLAPLGSPGLVAGAAATALGLRETSDRTALDVVTGYLKARLAIIVLDNCEHVIDDAALVANAMLRGCPHVTVLATSREPLDIEGEQLYHVPSLDVPAADAVVSPSEASVHGAIALFVERAKAVDSRFSLSDAAVPLVTEICRRLDGIPLAIELAAARVKLLSLRELARRLDERFQILTGGMRSAVRRQQTIHALIDWSYDLLSDGEKMQLRRLGVFSGGFTLAAAEAVCPGGSVTSSDVFDLLASLVDKSLVAPESEGESSRYRLLESTRAYALEKVVQSGEQPVVRNAHAEWVATIAETAYATRGSTPLSRWLAGVAPEIENIREALRWTIRGDGETDLGGRIAGALTSFWFVAGLVAEGRRWFELALAELEEDRHAAIVARLLVGLGRFAGGIRGNEATVRAISLYERLDDRDGLARSFGTLAWTLRQMGRFEEAETAAERSLALWKELGKTRSYEYAGERGGQATVLTALGRQDEARAAYAEVVGLFDALGEEEGASISRFNLAELEFAAGNPERALSLACNAVEALHRLRSQSREALALTNVAGYHLALGDVDAARDSARAVLVMARRYEIDCVPFAIDYLAAVAALRRQPQRAAMLLGYVDGWYEDGRFARGPTEERSHEVLVRSLREQLGEREINDFADRGRLLSQDRAVEEALEV